MRFCGLGQEFRARQPVLDDFCRAGKNHLPTFPNGQRWMIFAGLGKINYLLSPVDNAG